MTVYNLPTNYTESAFITVRDLDGDLWYYGRWNDFSKARAQADEIDGLVLQTEIVEQA